MNATLPASTAAILPPLAAPDAQSRFRYILRLADASLILAQRLGELIGHAPALEEDLGFANTALDLIGQARLLLTYAGEVEAKGRTEDMLAFMREDREFLNPTLVEQPNGDFAQTLVRQFLMDVWQLEMYERLENSNDLRLRQIAAKAVKEVRYHVRYSSNWLIRLGDGTQESHDRAQAALAALWPYTAELFEADALDMEMTEAGIAPDLEAVRRSWNATVSAVLEEATLTRPPDRPFLWCGKRGDHSEHLSRMLAEMQYLPRAHPGAQW